MARESHDREDLLRDATAYVTRMQLTAQWSHAEAEVFVGFHATGAVSFYFDQDPVYHFNRSSELRRAFVDNELIKSENGSLVKMRRQRDDSEVALVRQVLSDDEQADFCGLAFEQLSQLRTSLAEGRFAIDGIVSRDHDKDVLARVREYLDHLTEIKVAASPKVTA